MHEIMREFAGFLGALTATFFIYKIIRMILKRTLSNRISQGRIVWVSFLFTSVLMVAAAKMEFWRAYYLYVITIAFWTSLDLLQLRLESTGHKGRIFSNNIIYNSISFAISIVILFSLVHLFLSLDMDKMSYEECMIKYGKDINNNLAVTRVSFACRQIINGDRADYSKCILNNMHGVMNDAAAVAVIRECENKYPSDSQVKAPQTYTLTPIDNPSDTTSQNNQAINPMAGPTATSQNSPQQPPVDWSQFKPIPEGPTATSQSSSQVSIKREHVNKQFSQMSEAELFATCSDNNLGKSIKRKACAEYYKRYIK